jgi:hypothetical protein
LDVIDLVPIDYRRIIELIEIYADLGLGFVDASTRRSLRLPNASTSAGWQR